MSGRDRGRVLEAGSRRPLSPFRPPVGLGPGLPAGINERSERPPRDFTPVAHSVEHSRREGDVRGTKTGGSLTSPSLFPVRPQVLVEDGDNSKGINKMAEMELVTLAAPEVEHTPLCAFHILRLRLS